MRKFLGLMGAVVLTVGLSACSGSDEPEPDPLETIEVDPPETEVQPDPDPVGNGGDDDEPGSVEYEHPVPALEIDDDGQAGAEAAAVYFVELFSYVYATGDFEAWDELTTDGCNFCGDVRDRVGEIYAAGGHGVTDAPTFESVTPHVWDSSPGDYSVEVLFTSPAVETFDADGQTIRAYEETTTRTWVLVEFRDEAWYVLGAEGESVE